MREKLEKAETEAARLAGHSNINQKIQYVQHLKESNWTLTEVRTSAKVFNPPQSLPDESQSSNSPVPTDNVPPAFVQGHPPCSIPASLSAGSAYVTPKASPRKPTGIFDNTPTHMQDRSGPVNLSPSCVIMENCSTKIKKEPWWLYAPKPFNPSHKTTPKSQAGPEDGSSPGSVISPLSKPVSVTSLRSSLETVVLSGCGSRASSDVASLASDSLSVRSESPLNINEPVAMDTDHSMSIESTRSVSGPELGNESCVPGKKYISPECSEFDSLQGESVHNNQVDVQHIDVLDIVTEKTCDQPFGYAIKRSDDLNCVNNVLGETKQMVLSKIENDPRLPIESLMEREVADSAVICSGNIKVEHSKTRQLECNPEEKVPLSENNEEFNVSEKIILSNEICLEEVERNLISGAGLEVPDCGRKTVVPDKNNEIEELKFANGTRLTQKIEDPSKSHQDPMKWTKH